MYSGFRGHEIMYHVCTMLPLKEKDTQRVDRKRHIGNDVVVIVFKDSSDKDDAFDPAIFKSHFICNTQKYEQCTLFFTLLSVFVCVQTLYLLSHPCLKKMGQQDTTKSALPTSRVSLLTLRSCQKISFSPRDRPSKIFF